MKPKDLVVQEKAQEEFEKQLLGEEFPVAQNSSAVEQSGSLKGKMSHKKNFPKKFSQGMCWVPAGEGGEDLQDVYSIVLQGVTAYARGRR